MNKNCKSCACYENSYDGCSFMVKDKENCPCLLCLVKPICKYECDKLFDHIENSGRIERSYTKDYMVLMQNN